MMRRLVLLCSLALVLASAASAQWLQRGPVALYLQAIAKNSNGVLYAGVGLSANGNNGMGVYKSADTGATWNPVNTGLPVYRGSNGRVPSIVVKGDTVYAVYIDPNAGLPKIYRSVNGGSSWAQTQSGFGGNPSYLYAVADGILCGSSDNKCYKTTNGGANWNLLGAIGIVPERIYEVSGRMYASSFAGTYISTNGGATWTAHPSLDASSPTVLCIEGHGDTLIAGVSFGVYRSLNHGSSWTYIDPRGPGKYTNRLQYLGSSLFAYTSFSSGGGAGSWWRSTDDGTTWTEWFGDLPADGNAYCTSDFLQIGNYTLAGIGLYGVYATTDNGVTWATRNNGLTPLITPPAIWSDGKTLIASGGSYKTFRSTDEGESWLESSQGLPAKNTGAVWIKDSLALTSTTIIHRSADGGKTWSNTSGLTNNTVYAFAELGDSLFAGTNAGICRSGDRGRTWNLANTGSTLTEPRLFASVGNDLFAAGKTSFAAGALFRSTDFGGSWTRAGADSIKGVVSAMVAANGNLFLIVDGLPGTIWRSTDHGATWSRQMNGLPSSLYFPNPYGLAASGSRIFTTIVQALNDSVYASDDNGGHWYGVSEGFPTSFTGFASVAVSNSHIFLAVTGGSAQGVYKRKLSDIIIAGVTGPYTSTPRTISLSQNYPNPFNPATELKFAIAKRGHVTLKIVDLLGREIATLVDDELTAGEHQAVWNAAGQASGVYYAILRSGAAVETRKLLLTK